MKSTFKNGKCLSLGITVGRLSEVRKILLVIHGKYTVRVKIYHHCIVICFV